MYLNDRIGLISIIKDYIISWKDYIILLMNVFDSASGGIISNLSGMDLCVVLKEVRNKTE